MVGVGEVKGNGEGRYQLLAAMQAYRNRDGGEVACWLRCQQTQPRRHLYLYQTTQLDEVLAFVEHLAMTTSGNLTAQLEQLSLQEQWAEWKGP